MPGFRFSRASYLLSLLRPVVVRDLNLAAHGLRVHLRNPSSFTPLRDGRHLLLGMDAEQNRRQIAKFSERDAVRFERFEQLIGRLGRAVEPLLDAEPPDAAALSSRAGAGTGCPPHWTDHRRHDRGMRGVVASLWTFRPLVRALRQLGADALSFAELLVAPAAKLLDRWFEADVLKATLATDAIIGAMVSPYSAGSGYVLLHHVMGELEGQRNAWGYVEGGMGAVSNAIARSAVATGRVSIFTDADVTALDVRQTGCHGVRVGPSGRAIRARYAVLSNATPQVTFDRLLSAEDRARALPEDFRDDVARIDYTSPVCKINVAIRGLPSFSALPSTPDGAPGPHHQCTIHLGCETMQAIDDAYRDARAGRPSQLCVAGTPLRRAPQH